MFEFIKTPFFAKMVERYLDDNEYVELQAHLNKNPEADIVVPGSKMVLHLSPKSIILLVLSVFLLAFFVPC